MDTDNKESQKQDGAFIYDEQGFPYVIDVPPAAFKCRSYLEFYRLKERKRKHSFSNIEINKECFYLVKATRTDRWYVREITEFTNPSLLLSEIAQGRIYLLYTDEVADSVRGDVKRSGLSYGKYLMRADAAMREEQASKEVYYDSGKVTNMSIHKDNINNIKKYH